MLCLSADTQQQESETQQQRYNCREICIEVLLHATKLSVGKHEHLSHYLKRITHLTLNGNVNISLKKEQNAAGPICKIQNLHHCPNLKVLYLYDNTIETIENLDVVPQLTHLYLQNNKVQKIENLESLALLEKLYLDNNNIVKLEGLRNCFQLKELSLANQDVPLDKHFSFEEDTMQTLACSLRVLDLSNCRVVSLAPIIKFRCLEQLDVSKNLIYGLEEVFGLVQGITSLVELDLRGNEVTLMAKYREKLITFSSSRLTLLDKKSIDPNQRRMMQSHLAHKYRKRMKSSSRHQNLISSEDTRDERNKSTKLSNFGPTGKHLRCKQVFSFHIKDCLESDDLKIAG
ncbi:Protein phosphatase 1, regulatory subunit, and related proteins [Plasmopara halstedii]|uniref:Protein phosphatase 1, regulatory subunit, and related proteins n=1 Tax=Plasmopara halstedii TaxID=4781 RepID=A0A0P1AZ86_PLAHL|nr:Protein phosphatase 1, regulatory subunit, and related proteins [Plasmopara halstedii]CEG46234.1 Protein phosphatase 1, regulatory subunit, and related proteins [Plasmopara halstedii]|eukprot:XP_024582603.1 Protein phosphatase 1, regulatory subunit, and related proteins [Plasmopara halstedii]